MDPSDSLYTFKDDGVTFVSGKAAGLRNIYLPLCGTDSDSLKASISPYLGGDIKIDKEHFLTKPVSTEDLRNGLRQFFVHVQGHGLLSIAPPDEGRDERVSVEIGQLWHRLTRTFPGPGVELEAVNFVPVTGERVELMRMSVRNVSDGPLTVTPTLAVPLFARALANKHDHEHVTSLLHRLRPLPSGVLVSPSMIFHEEGHRPNGVTYFVLGAGAGGQAPEGVFPTFDSFYGPSGTWFYPQAVCENWPARMLSDRELQGREAVGGLRFQTAVLKPGETVSCFAVAGVADGEKEAVGLLKKFARADGFAAAWEENKTFWKNKQEAIRFETGDAGHDAWMRWVMIQPVFRRIYGCSFLPDHDYGKGGKGWRDLWQDLLSLILIEPGQVRDSLLNNFSGVRIDGSNATIIGAAPGEFVADRNAITRVWMDHGLWPLTTMLLYLDQTGDYDVLFEERPYFRDPQLSRAFQKDASWSPEDGDRLKTGAGEVYRGSVLEHLLVQHLVQFFNVGEHNAIRLESADWNDGLDMAFERGESVAFTSYYGRNLLDLADLLEDLARIKKMERVVLAKEIFILLDSLSDKPCDYGDIRAKQDLLFRKYFPAVQPTLSGETAEAAVGDLVGDLRRKGRWIIDHIRAHEWIEAQSGKKAYGWFNGYYDNTGERVEGIKDWAVRMTLTGQVLPIMSGVAEKDRVRAVWASVNAFLKDPDLGGYRLNTDFGVDHYLHLGRAFGFAYGAKENGAFFSHMTVMFAAALYGRGFVREGYEVLRSIYRMCADTDRSRIYPGIPEYLDSEGRGMYHYLTGSASWLILTELTQSFGVRGRRGDLLIRPQLVAEQFGPDGTARVHCQFVGKGLTVLYENKDRLDFGRYGIREVLLNDRSLTPETKTSDEVLLKREALAGASSPACIRVVLAAK